MGTIWNAIAPTTLRHARGAIGTQEGTDRTFI